MPYLKRGITFIEFHLLCVLSFLLLLVPASLPELALVLCLRSCCCWLSVIAGVP
jgi:hypothetical protein